MRDLAVIDSGGTTIKFAAQKNNDLMDVHSVDPPKSLEEFYGLLEHETNDFMRKYDV